MPRCPELALLHHIPNGGRRNLREAAKLKRLGVLAGVPDLFLPVGRGEYHGLYVEMKAPPVKGQTQAGRLSAPQKHVIALLRAQGYRVDVCHTWHTARDVIVEYLSGGAREAKNGEI